MVYEPERELRLGICIWREMICELWASRELVWRLFMRDLSARYKQSVLGYVWAVAPAIAVVGAFTYMSRSRILPIPGTAMPYPAYVLLGLAVWQFFATGLTACTGSLVGAGALVSKINFPREVLVVAAYGQAVFELLIKVILVAAVFAWYRIIPAWTVVVVPLALIPLSAMTIGLGFVFALGSTGTRDAITAAGFANGGYHRQARSMDSGGGTSCGSGGGAESCRWRPTTLAVGTCDAYVWYTSHPNGFATVPITVVHAAESTPKTFNEQVGGDEWVVCGSSSFNAGTGGYV